MVHNEEIREEFLQEVNKSNQYSSNYEFEGIIDEETYKGLNWIYNVRIDLNTKSSNIKYEMNLQDEINNLESETQTSFYQSVFRKYKGNIDSNIEYIIYRLKHPYKTFQLQFDLRRFNEKNALGLLRGHLVRFILLNPKLRNWEILYKVFHLAVSRINKYSEASIGRPDIVRTSLVEQALNDTQWLGDELDIVNEQIKIEMEKHQKKVDSQWVSTFDEIEYTVDITADYYRRLSFANDNYWYTGLYGPTNREICFNVENKYKSITKYDDINESVDSLINDGVFVSYETIKEKLNGRGERQIREVIHDRKKEIVMHNRNKFGIVQYKTYLKRNAEHLMNDEIFTSPA
ncbi:hypothetical protein HNS38_07305 [Lentimicrobium sp. L6]|uniref:hypothetical protein n=1 Tax=Lentimicrobium sp. L6 TaxID=2735916 RepID=UPI0015550100|nr:hypothetical protein [Lentimicrobium sp. L6]NPD84558.1 hypothetical protein [Lentimicrobium sp. L6]